MAVLIRLARESDAAAIAGLYRPYVESSRISFEEVAPDSAEIARRMASPVHPWLVAEDDGRLLGFASTSPMRNRPAYRWSVETGIYLDPAITARVADGLLDGGQHGRRAPAAAISDRESEVLRLVAVGHSNKEIADRLTISIETVEVHKANAMRKLGLSGRVDLIRYGVLQGWLYDI